MKLHYIDVGLLLGQPVRIRRGGGRRRAVGRAVGTRESEVRVRNWSITGFIEIGNRATISQKGRGIEIGRDRDRRPPISIPGKTSVKRVVITAT